MSAYGDFRMVLALLVILILLHSSISIDWCKKDLDCEIPNGTEVVILKNTACDKVEHESLRHCQFMVKRPDSAVKQTLMAMHNTFRDRIASGGFLSGWPTAADMRQMTWDDSLAEQALRWAFQCDDKEDDPCRTHPVYEEEGQNLGVVKQSSPSASIPDLADVFRKWISEALKAPSSIVDVMAPGDHLHLAEIIYSRAQKVGCGVIDYEDVSGQKAVRVVCNYDIEYEMGKALYAKGDNCSCPADTSCKPDSTYKKLCALINDPVGEKPVVVDFDETKPSTEFHPISTSSYSETTTVGPVARSTKQTTALRTAGLVPQETTWRTHNSQAALLSCRRFLFYEYIMAPLFYHLLI